MAAVRHLGCSKEAFHTSGDTKTKFGRGILIGGGDMPPELNLKQFPIVAKFYFRFQFRHVSCYGTVRPISDRAKFQRDDTQTDVCMHACSLITRERLRWLSPNFQGRSGAPGMVLGAFWGIVILIVLGLGACSVAAQPGNAVIERDDRGTGVWRLAAA